MNKIHLVCFKAVLNTTGILFKKINIVLSINLAYQSFNHLLLDHLFSKLEFICTE